VKISFGSKSVNVKSKSEVKLGKPCSFGTVELEDVDATAIHALCQMQSISS